MITAVSSAYELNCRFDRKLPDGVTFSGTIKEENGISVMVNDTTYVAAILRFNGIDNTNGVLELDLKTEGQVPTALGAILYRRENGKLVKVSTLAWLKIVPRESFGTMTFNIAPGTFKSHQAYEIYLYRANQKGTLKFRSVTLQLAKVGRGITFNYRNTPDLVGPLKSGPSGKPDIHIRITGVNPSKSIREIVVTRAAGRWVSGDDVKKNFWMIQYYDSADFPSRRNPRNNFNGVLHTNLSCIDMVFEDTYVEGAEYLCEVFYSDGTVDKWKTEKENIPPPPVPLTFGKSILTGNSTYPVPAGWRQPRLGAHSFFSLVSDKERLKDGLLMQGLSHRRLWSPAWFLPFAGHNRKPSESQVRKLCSFASRAALREIQLFDVNGRNIASSAKVSGECTSPWLDLPKVIDGDVSLDSAARASEPSVNQPQIASITLTFPEPVKLSRAILHHGCRNGCLAGHTARDFFLEYLADGKWQTVNGCSIQGNTAERTEHALGNLETTALRLNITRENELVDFRRFDWSFDNAYLNIKKAESVPSDATFHYWYLGHDSSIHFALPEDDYVPEGQDKYREWRKKHPNFMGFQVVEFDNDFRHTLGWGGNRDQKDALGSYEYASRHFVVRRNLPKLPATREEACRQYEAIFRFYHRMMFNDCANFSSVTMWHHQPMEWGASSTVMECFGGGCPVFSMQIAAARGACRQYGNKPWGCYFATYLGNGYLNYLKTGGVFGPNCGKSASLYRRQNYLAYLMGATYVDFEHPDIAFVREKYMKGAEPVLSPHGLAVLEVAEFARKDPERGDVYTPFALLLDFNHGWDSHESRKIWYGMFPPTAADRNIDVWMKGVFGHSELAQEGYGCNMSQTGFSGLADILVVNPPSGIPRNLKDYPAAIVAGDIRWSDHVVNGLKEYVVQGGTLVINSEQLPKTFDHKFTGVEITGKKSLDRTTISCDGRKLADSKTPYEYWNVNLRGAQALLKTSHGQPLATVFTYGKGKVILTLQRYLIESPSAAGQKAGVPAVHYLLSLLRHEFLPFKVTGNSPAEVVAGRLKNGWRISLLNNRGVYKLPLSAPVVVSAEKTEQTVTFPGEFKSAVERITGRRLEVRNVNGENQFTISIPAGDLAVIDILP